MLTSQAAAMDDASKSQEVALLSPFGRAIYRNLSTPRLVEEAVRRHEGGLTNGGALVVLTGEHTGRAPKDKFIVREPGSEERIWWGEVNRPIDEARYAALRDRLTRHLDRNDVFVQDCVVCADPRYRIPVRIITESAWYALFARTMFIPDRDTGNGDAGSGFTIIHAPTFRAEPERDGVRSNVFVILNLKERTVLIGGTAYGGEIKKSIFTVLNDLLPRRDVLSMHCSANVGHDGEVAIFFGLSGTGKTSLSADPARDLIGDDEHGWGVDGIFNLEGGCYAKMIRLSAEAEPEIFAAAHAFGTILENVGFDPRTGEVDFDDESLTENTRAVYPLASVPNVFRRPSATHPGVIFMLTADAFGVLPPVSRLNADQAMYYFLSGYTAKVAGTERGVTEPEATFSTCFASPFLTLPPVVYAEMLGDRIAKHGVDVWMVNTGWTGGPYGVGERLAIAHSRAMIRAALSGELAGVPTRRDPVFGLEVPISCPSVPVELLTPRATWADPDAYDRQAARLAVMFSDNFQQFAGQISSAVAKAGPRVP